MRIAILGADTSWYFRDLARAADGRCEVFAAPFTELAGSISSSSPAREVFQAGPHDLGSCDAVLVRSMPPGSLEQVIFRMDLLARLEAAGTLVVNPPKALEAAIDKYLSLARLAAAGLRVPRTFVCQTVEQAMAAWNELGGKAVVKPLFGSEGRGITCLDDEALAWRALKMLAELGYVLYLQEYIPHHGFDLRLLVIDQRVFAMRRISATDWRTNVSRGATTEPLDPDAQTIEMAIAAARTLGAPVAGVDLLPGRDGRTYVLEINAVPGWRALARTLRVDVAAELLTWVEQSLGRLG